MTDFTVQMRTSYKILRDSKFKGRILMQGMIRIGEFDEIFKEANDNIINGKSFESIEWNDHSEIILHIPVFDEEALVKHKSTEIRNLCELLQHFYNDIRFVSNEFISFDSRFSQDPSKTFKYTWPHTPETIWKRYQDSEIARIVEKNGHVWFDLWS